MTRGTIRLVGAAGAVLLLGLGIAYWRSDERRINRRLAQLEELMTKDAPEGQLAAAARARSVVGFFAPGFLVRAEPYEGQITDSQQLAAAVLRYRSAARKIVVSFHDRELEVRPNRTALGHFVATVTMDLGDDDRGRESYRVRAQWMEEGGVWQIHTLEVLEVLEEPGLDLL